MTSGILIGQTVCTSVVVINRENTERIAAMKWNLNVVSQETVPSRDYDLIIYPVKINWNDFTYNYRTKIYIKHPARLFHFDLFVVPLADGKIIETISAAIKKGFNNAFTLFFKCSSYRDLAHQLTESEYISLLKTINDISSAKYIKQGSVPELEHVIDSENFRLGVLRSAHTFDAFLHGFKNSFHQDPIDDARVDFEIFTTLPGCFTALHLPISHKNHQHFQDRVHCLIGVNGVGKTQLLRGIIIGAANNFYNKNQWLPKTIFRDKDGQMLIDEESNIKFRYNFSAFSRVVAYTSDSESALPASSEIGGFDYSFFNMNDSSTGFSYDKHLSYLLASLYRSDADPLLNKWAIFESAVLDIAPASDLMIPVRSSFTDNIFILDKNNNKWVLVKNLSGEQRILDIFGMIDPSRDLCFLSRINNQPIKLSSGQRSFFRFILHFLTHAGMGTLLLIDEPETHLHPNLISEYMMLLYSILEKTKSIAIIATHSTYVVREAPTHCVHILKKSDGRTFLESVYMNTLGANVSSLSMAVFGDNTVSNYHRKISQEIASTSLPLNSIIEQYKDIFSLDMLIEIRARIESRDVLGDI